MRNVWVTARQDFTFGGVSHAAGQVFEANGIDALQMMHRRWVSRSKPKPATPERPPQPAVEPEPTRRRARRVTMPAGSPFHDGGIIEQIHEQSQRRFVEGDTTLNPIGIPTGQTKPFDEI